MARGSATCSGKRCAAALSNPSGTLKKLERWTIFGVRGEAELELEHIKNFLDQADDEPLLWEAKGTKLDKAEVRRQVCAFANSHEGGYLILGAERASSGGGGPRVDARWR
jgi:hypothetical protein